VGLSIRQPRRFGGVGNFHLLPPSVRGHVFRSGEAAGLQDALWGFGIRYAIRSAALAATYALDADPHPFRRTWEERIGGYLRTSLVNRYLRDRAGKLGDLYLLRRLSQVRDPRRYLRRLYAPARWKRAVLPFVYRGFERPRESARPDCCCTWCRASEPERG